MEKCFCVVVVGLLLVSFVTSQTPLPLAEVEKLALNCLKSSNVSADAVKILDRKPDSRGNVDDNVKCYTKCILENFNILKNGAFDEEMLRLSVLDTVSDNKFQNIIKQCGKFLKDSDKDCNAAYLVFNCVSESMAWD